MQGLDPGTLNEQMLDDCVMSLVDQLNKVIILMVCVVLGVFSNPKRFAEPRSAATHSCHLVCD
jgi:hypothetical protein